MFKTQIDMLQSNINYYWGKPERQCKLNHKCAYSPKSIGKEETSEECAKYFKVKSCQVTNALNQNFKFKKYKVENYE